MAGAGRSRARPCRGRRPRADAGERVTRAVTPTVDEAETITRTLLLAQRTADTTMAEARVEADRLLNDARERATASDEAARVEREELLEAARIEARRTGEAERVQVEGEVQALLARRDFLVSDVDHLEQFIAAQRERLIEASAEISAIVQRVPNGLADMRRPLLSAAADDDAPDGRVHGRGPRRTRRPPTPTRPATSGPVAATGPTARAETPHRSPSCDR